MDHLKTPSVPNHLKCDHKLELAGEKNSVDDFKQRVAVGLKLSYFSFYNAASKHNKTLIHTCNITMTWLWRSRKTHCEQLFSSQIPFFAVGIFLNLNCTPVDETLISPICSGDCKAFFFVPSHSHKLLQIQETIIIQPSGFNFWSCTSKREVTSHSVHYNFCCHSSGQG